MRVLIVSLLERDRETYAQAFRQRGYCTLQAATPSDACRLALELRPAAIVADVHLSICEDGIPLARRLRQESGLRHVPMLILAGTSAHAAAPPVVTAGVDLYVTPGGDAQRVVETVNSLIHLPLPMPQRSAS
jgi:CheY-like chemotaxis protein